MNIIGNEQMKVKLQSYRIKQPQIKCSSQHQIDRMCINSKCLFSSLHCSNKKCQTSYLKHLYCKNINLDGVTSLLNKPFDDHKQLLTTLFQNQNNFINQLIKSRDDIISKIMGNTLQKKDRDLVQQIFLNKNKERSKGREINQFYQRLCQHNLQEVFDKKYIIQGLIAKQTQLFRDIKIERQKILKTILFEQKYIDSKIIDNKIQFIQFIKTHLKNPTKIQLLFRASQNQFSAFKFHQKCDNIEGTLTVILTQFNKIIGGFTPLKWNSQASGTYVSDNNTRSFIFSLSLMQKMTLKQLQFAIYNRKQFGPIFGGGHDICLSDKCNQNKSSYACFPTSYNSTQYAGNQQSFSLFSGVSQGKHFKVLQYQVFRVIK